MSLISCQAAMVRVLAAKFPTINVSEHDGAFTVEELDRVAKKLPAIVVVCLNARGADEGVVLSLNGSWAAFCVTKNEIGSEDKRYSQGGRLAEAVAATVLRERWEKKASSAASSVDLNNLFSAAIAKRGVTLFAVRWRQSVDLIPAEALAELENFETFYGQYKVGTPTSPAIEQQVELETDE